MPTFEASKHGYYKLWNDARIKADRRDSAINTARKAFAARAKYKAVEAKTGVPWEFIAPAHMRESGMNFNGVLHNGERIIGTGKKTSLVPAGRGPFNSWEEAAVDALKLKGLDKITTWSTEMILFQQERFNGFGYVGKINSPYIWAWTNLQQRGKYTSDHGYDPNVWDVQCGTAAMLKAMEELDPETRERLSSRTPILPPEVVKEATKEVTRKDKKKAGGAAAGGAAAGGATVGTQKPDEPVTGFAHQYLLPVVFIVFAAAMVVFLIRMMRKSKHVRAMAGAS